MGSACLVVMIATLALHGMCVEGNPVSVEDVSDNEIVNSTGQSNSSCPDFVSRSAWGAAEATLVTNMSVPVPYVLIHHTYIPGPCNSSTACSRAMRSMQNFHQEKGWGDIGYNFVIGGDNNVYVGRGWDIVGAHSPKYNQQSIGICFIGDYRTTLPSTEMLDLAKDLIRCGVDRGSIDVSYKLLGHRQVRPTECPGNKLFTEIQTWPNWDPLIDIVPRT